MSHGRVRLKIFDSQNATLRRAQAAGLAAIVVLCGYNLIQYAFFVIQTPWSLDFSDFYLAAQRGLTRGWAEMYNAAVSMPALYAASGNSFPYQHSPVLAWVLVPLSLLPYLPALAIWNAFLLGCFVLCWRMLVRGSTEQRLVFLVAGFGLYPIALGLALGQPTMVVLAAVSLCWWLLGRDQPLLAGVALALIAIKPQSSFLVPFALLFAGRLRLFTSWALLTAGLVVLAVLALGLHGLHEWANSISIATHLPGIRFNSVGSVLGPGPLALVINAIAAVLTLVIGRLAAGDRAELPVAAGLSGSLLVTPYLSVTDVGALLIAAWLVLRLDPPRWLTMLMVVGYVPFFFANALFMHGPFLLLEGVWLLALLAFAVKRQREREVAGAKPIQLAA